MGRSKKTPAPPKIKTVAPPAEEVDPAIMAMFMRQQRAGKAKAYLTRGQRTNALAKEKAAAAPRVSGQEAEEIKTRKKNVFEGYKPKHKIDITKALKGKSFTRRRQAVEELENRAKFLSEQQGDIEQFETPTGVERKLTRASKKHGRDVQKYIIKTKKQLQKEYTTTQLRNLGIK